VLECSVWDYIRNSTLEEIKTVLHEDSSLRWDDLSPELKIQIVMDIANIQKTLNIKNDSVNLIGYQARRLLYLIHGTQYRLIVKKTAEIGEGITTVFGVTTGETVKSYHIIL
jgi:hypothetical protein